MSAAREDSAPCAVPSKLWRECLKQYDYGPDRPKGACEAHRTKFYDCVKDWTARTQHKSYSYTQFELPKSCGHEAEKLHQCMMMNMFEVSHCQRDMAVLKRCAARADPEVRKYLQDDEAIADLENDIEEATGLKRLWYKAIGKL
ncbi:hypothetical protein conserved [Leishmania donovani]|uniref:Uncharacterized protein n=3 Tax=Leishmania donovani species complex TaxID=38574 RepID=A4I2I7_LEIIN|nr:conserved hypothetical protein [Leishmania infantum JPCM5]TPP52122.1 hypothetical protein CGC20_5695 [Leishmania donovani]CAC9497827.1 hypothetical_protein_-_conserved [Leishmania infantum]CAJ1989843.1 hypothetical protein conserved [Leishmania donovani]CAM68980.1 conserved hypothetical protein [Leishmania infantum JPCM5]SUZ42848.1 hypothetical_protein_-_conserved [Leishmania infantum]|eukprot:XP_001470598.1 conserved hypothetical protein [Leishmania infantum JPCM5]